MEKQKQFDLAVTAVAVTALAISLVYGFMVTERVQKLEASLNVLTQGQYEAVTMEDLAKMNEQIKASNQQPSQTSQPATQP